MGTCATIMSATNDGTHAIFADSCCTAVQVLLLLKSSDRVAHDICHAFDGCEAPPKGPVQHALALRKWVALRPERELRCFVRQRELIGGHSACAAALRPAVKARGCDCIDPCRPAPLSFDYLMHLILHYLGFVRLTAALGPIHAHMAGCAIRQHALSLFCKKSFMKKAAQLCRPIGQHSSGTLSNDCVAMWACCAVQQSPSAMSWRAPTSCSHRWRGCKRCCWSSLSSTCRSTFLRPATPLMCTSPQLAGCGPRLACPTLK